MEASVLHTHNVSLNILVIGEMVEHQELLHVASLTHHRFYWETDVASIFELTSHTRFDLIFGTISYQGTSYFSTLQSIKQRNVDLAIIVFISPEDAFSLNEVLMLQCERYLCLETEKDKAAVHLKSAIQELSQSDIFLSDMQYFEALLDASIVSQSDTEGNITYINDNFTKVTGYTPSEVIGKNHRILRHPANDKEIYQDMWRTITQGKVWRERVLNKNKDGSDFWGDTIIIPFKDTHTGKIVQYLAVRQDITQMLLEKRAVQEQEKKAQEQMKLSEAKDAFLVLFTHELKTPLNAIMNFSQYLYKHMPNIEEIPKEKRMHLLEQIYKSAHSMLENVSNILDLGKLRHQKLHYNLTFFNAKESILDVIEKHGALALEYHRTMVFHSDDSEPFLSSDEYRFKQILSNVLSNAIKYGTSTVEITLSSSKETLVITIEDDGKGIRDQDKEEVFELYNQSASKPSSMEKKGTGIGLHFVKLLCEGLGFEYCLEDSAHLGGVKFSLTKRLKEPKYV